MHNLILYLYHISTIMLYTERGNEFSSCNTVQVTISWLKNCFAVALIKKCLYDDLKYEVIFFSEINVHIKSSYVYFI